MAPVSEIAFAASVTATGAGGEATIARLWEDAQPLVSAVMISPARSALVLVTTGTLLVVLPRLPNWPIPLYPQAATLPSAHSATLW